MFVELGHLALALALMLALAQASLPLIGARLGHGGLMALAIPTAIGQFLLLALAFAALTHAYVTSDFSVLNVVQNSHSLKPMLYKVAGVWGNHEGSLLLWVLILALFGALVALFGRNLPPRLKANTLAVQAMIAIGFIGFLLFTSNPFERLPSPPLDGQDLNPLLQDPGLAFHPPMLYVGYVGLSVSFSFAVAALIEGKVDAAWARWVRPWTLLAWAFLTGGIALGSWWAYYELGWGGFWYWDPVENASFMPWLIATALLHSAIVVEKRDTLKSWTILLAIIAFSLSLIGTFLVRSGVLTSVHAFAVDPGRGVYILALLAIAIGGSLTLYAWRAPALKGGGLFQPISREGGLLLNNLLMATATATVLIGTLYPLLLEVVSEDKVSVGPPFFNATFVPIMIPALVALGIGPFLAWKRGSLKSALARLKYAALAALAGFLITAWIVWGKPVAGLIGVAAGIWLLCATIWEVLEKAAIARQGLQGAFARLAGLPRAHWGMFAAHLGVAVCVLGVTGTSLWTTEVIRVMRPGEVTDVGGYQFRFDGTQDLRGPNYLAHRAHFTVMNTQGEVLETLSPEKRRYVVNGMETTEAGISSHLFYDLYAVIGDPDGKGGYAVRLYHKPLVPWIWTGAGLMMLGGLLSLSDRRLRVGAPRRTVALLPGTKPAPAE